MEIERKILKIFLQVERGIIVQAEITGDYFMQSQSTAIQNSLCQKKHDFDDVKFALPTNEIYIIYSFF